MTSRHASRTRTSTQNYDHLIKLILIGDEGTGKSSLMSRFCDQHFSHSYVATIGVDFKIRTIEAADGARIKMQMWDTAGQERFNSITKSFYRGAHVLVLVYDDTNRDSFRHTTKWLSGCLDVTGPQLPKCLIGNKADLSRIRQVDTEEGQSFADKHGMFFAETSAKEDTNVSSVFEEMASQYVKTVQANMNHRPTSYNEKISRPVHGGEEAFNDGAGSCWSLIFSKLAHLFSSKGDPQRGSSSSSSSSSSSIVDRKKYRERVVQGS